VTWATTTNGEVHRLTGAAVSISAMLKNKRKIKERLLGIVKKTLMQVELACWSAGNRNCEKIELVQSNGVGWMFE
jgi:hypothetical protein